MAQEKSLSNLVYFQTESPFLSELESIAPRKREIYAPTLKKIVQDEYKDTDGTVVAIKYEKTGIFKLADDREFVKIFTEPIYSHIKLTATGRRVFDAILEVYGKEAMKHGYVDTFYFKFFGKGANGGNTEKTKMSRDTFSRGMIELIENGFIAARLPGVWWVNPLIFFKGDRARYLQIHERIHNRKKRRDGMK